MVYCAWFAKFDITNEGGNYLDAVLGSGLLDSFLRRRL